MSRSSITLTTQESAHGALQDDIKPDQRLKADRRQCIGICGVMTISGAMGARRLMMTVFLLLGVPWVHGIYPLPTNYGRFEIKDAMSSQTADRLRVHCQRPSLDLQELVMYPGDIYIHDFYADDRVIKGWTCQFYWYDGDSEDIHLTQHFQVWNKNGTSVYLDGCDYCRWKVKEDGFYTCSHGIRTKHPRIVGYSCLNGANRPRQSSTARCTLERREHLVQALSNCIKKNTLRR
ncbi:hypothetical protein R1sor_020657 [Riccia sorocarpa]|uniref:S-protein homolog n=1 Tax=Riccia sorocarpa TaxID=122646 RepID=A0ABD3GGH2_9MARC